MVSSPCYNKIVENTPDRLVLDAKRFRRYTDNIFRIIFDNSSKYVYFVDKTNTTIFQIPFNHLKKIVINQERRSTGGKNSRTYYVNVFYIVKYDNLVYWIDTSNRDADLLEMINAVQAMTGLPIEDRNSSFGISREGNANYGDNDIIPPTVSELKTITETREGSHRIYMLSKTAFKSLVVIYIFFGFCFCFLTTWIVLAFTTEPAMGAFGIVGMGMFFIVAYAILRTYKKNERVVLSQSGIAVEEYSGKKKKSETFYPAGDIQFIGVNRLDPGQTFLSLTIRPGSPILADRPQKGLFGMFLGMVTASRTGGLFADNVIFIWRNPGTMSSNIIQELFYVEYQMQHTLQIKESEFDFEYMGSVHAS